MMPGLDLATGALTLPWWTAAAALVLVAVFCTLAFLRAGARRTAAAIARYAVVAAALILAAGILERFTSRDRADARRAVDARIGELTARAIAPGSPLACLDATAGEAVETACENALFATPDSVAAAVGYVSARLGLLADIVDHGKRLDGYDNLLLSLRRALETDRFGFVAHLLAYRDNCTPAVCDAFALMNDSSRVAANMRERIFDTLVERHAATWHANANASEPAPSAPTLASAPAANAPAGVPAATHYSFPSAASIPPVSIMNNEPAGPPGPAAVEAAPAPAPTAAAKKSAPTAKRGNPKAGAPVPITPQPPPAAASAGSGATLR
jgi:hypothetical protein